MRLHSEGMPNKGIASIVGVDVKTVPGYVAAAAALGLSG